MDEHCNEKISEALKELGYPTKVTFVNHFGAIEIPVNQGYIHLWDAQKWLREEKKLIVLVGFDFCPITSEIVYNWVIVVNGNTAKKSSYTYDYFEEALSEGIKEAVKILKENANIQ